MMMKYTKKDISSCSQAFTLIELLVTVAQQNCLLKSKSNTSLRPAGRTSRFFCGCKKSSSHLHIFTQSAFTLIELLVVIAIIAILAAMLLPALQQARERGRSAKCIANMKQSALAFSAYVDEYKGYLPPYKNGSTVNSNGKVTESGKTWFSARKGAGLLAPYVGMETDYDCAFAGYGRSTKNAGWRLIRHPLSCPTKDVKAEWVEGGNGIPGIGMNSRVNWYAVNLGVSGKTQPYQIDKAKYPSRGMVAMEKYKTGYIITYTHNVLTGSASTYAADYPHSDKSTIIFLDFHIDQLKRSKIPDQKINSSGANEAAYTSFWDPFRTLRANKLPSNNW